MPTVKQFQKGGKQEKPLDTGHFKTTTGKVVVWGTPEYREAYDRGEVVTDKGVKSPVTMKGQKLDEVVIQNNYKRGFWEKYKDKIIEENKDAGVLGAAVGVPISAVASLPQLAMMEGLTGKMQRPSEAMNIQNPYGAMAVNAVTDPANLIGAGVLTKEKVLAGLARSTEDGVLSNAHKLNPFSGANPFIKKVGNDVGLVKDLIFDKNTTLNKNFIFDSKNKIYNQIEEGYRTLDNSLEQKINELGSEEGRRRLINQEKEYLQDFYYDPKNVDLEKAATENADARIEELENIKAFGNKNKEFAYNVDLNKVNKTGIIKPNIESVQYRYDIPTNNAHYQYTDDIIDNPSGSKMLPGELTLGRGYEDSVPTAFHEINHALQRGRTLKIDNELKNIVPDFKKNMSYDDIDAYNYFKSGSDGKESSSFLAELRSQMQQDGFIKNTYDNVTPELIEKAKDYYSKNKSKKVFIKDSGLQGITNTRILDFSRPTPENYKIISDAMNKLPAIAPIAGASYLATQPQYKNGGKHTNSEQNFLKDYLKDGGQKTDKERQAYAFYINRGWTPEQALGIVGNLIRESGLNTTIVGTADDKGSQGVAQWHSGRLKALKNKYGSGWTDFQNQLEFVDWELKNTEKAAGDRLKKTRGVWEAGQVVSDFYERPKVKFVGDERRQRHVADLAMKFKGIKLTPEDNINYGVTFENSVAPYMNAPQAQATPLPTIQVPEIQTQQLSYLDTPQETTNLAEETEQKQSKINPQEEAFMQDLLSQMAEGVGYVEPQKSAVFQDGGQIPISSEGMYAYPNQPVIIPSSRITMKNIPHSILAVTDQGDRQILQPEKEYQLKGNNTLEIPLTKAEENFLKDIYETS